MLLSSLPFVHEFFFDDNYELYSWVPNLGIRELLSSDGGETFLGIPYYDVFLYNVSLLLWIFFGALIWRYIKKRRLYETALLLPLISISYHLLILLLNAKGTAWNDPFNKLTGQGVIAITLAILHYYRHLKVYEEHRENLESFGVSIKKAFTGKLILVWAGLFLVATLPYLSALMAVSVGEIESHTREWVPDLGIEKFLTLSDGTVWGFVNYKVFLHELFINLMGLVLWSGCFFDSKSKLYMAFFLIPVILGVLEVAGIAINWNTEYIGHPGSKLAITLTVGFAAAIFLFVKNKHLKPKAIPPM
ncbi:MAG: hypothetical protein AAGA43_13515 [Bacteroidota bacterium]